MKAIINKDLKSLRLAGNITQNWVEWRKRIHVTDSN